MAIGMVSANLSVWFTAHIYATIRVGYIPLLPSLIRPALLAILVPLLGLTFVFSVWFMGGALRGRRGQYPIG